ncbi:hypothetical protein Aeqsu_0763 [Aequorivita sublithincola DSM 14238]|uniref:Uncharacterized protein n=1 Tax=Aequorivita sublithincola (strain DSM 14238 / LMG 21431 / ACAM 643 / 9-3) TaxID=746697 RepID=I3YTF2_AEQSU|nr:hypothetical protein [Aequorivita sublithincola]AFL80270.1 hypothetical protein Aeqsu_0763 [Aequorivita sublithincola DSM 14238]
MTSEEFRNSIKRGRLQLSITDMFSYFRISLLLFIISIFCLTTGFQSLTSAFYEDQPLGIIGGTFLLITIIHYYFLNRQLKIRSVSTTVSKEEFQQKINKLAKEQHWKTTTISENFMEATLKRNGMNSRSFLDRSCGERIYIYKDTQTLYFKSMFDLDQNIEFTISSGENQLNEKIIKSTFQSS